MISTTYRGIGRSRYFAKFSPLVAGGLAAAAVIAAPAAIGTTLPQGTGGWAQSWPKPACGNESDNIDLWNDVKNASPTSKGNNIKVVFPNNDKNLGYAMHDGTEPTKTKYNYLLISAIREQGIECPNLLESGAPEYFRDAFENIDLLPANTDWALGIESANNRSRNQLHIHVSRLQSQARTDIDAAAKSIAGDEKGWANAHISVMGKQFRAWNASSMDHNLFSVLDREIVSPLKGSMGNETLLVTANHKGSGYIVLNSDKVSDLKPGVDNIELLLNKTA